MGKSVTGTLLGVLIQQGAYELWQPAPIPEWQTPGDPRAKIRIGDILQHVERPAHPCAAGSRLRPERSVSGPSLFSTPAAWTPSNIAATRPQQWPPDTVGRYRNTDPVLTNYLIRLAVEKRKEDYHAFPQRALVRQDRHPQRWCSTPIRTATS